MWRGLAGWALGIVLGTLLSVGPCAAGQFESPDVEVQTDAPQPETPQIGTPIDATMARLRRIEKVAGFDPARLSAASRNLFSLADRWTACASGCSEAFRALRSPGKRRVSPWREMPLTLGTDLRQSRYSGFTQSETATAWCGSNVVMGFNDSGAEVTTMASGRGVSMDGYAQSSNRGATFTYMGSLDHAERSQHFHVGRSGRGVRQCGNLLLRFELSRRHQRNIRRQPLDLRRWR